MSNFGAFVGRLLLASLFLMSGALKLAEHNPKTGGPVTAYMRPKMDEFLDQFEPLVGHKVRLEPEHYQYLVLVAAGMELVGGALFVMNVKFGAVLLVLFIIPVSIVMHNFWALEEGTGPQQVEFVNFFKNVCLMGAFLMYINMPNIPAAATRQRKQKAL